MVSTYLFQNMCNNAVIANNDVVEIQSVQKFSETLEFSNNEDAAGGKVDCAKCLDIPHAFCLAEPDNQPMKVRMDFDDMVEKMTKNPEDTACSCIEGYLPIYHPESGFLMRCHDPIIKTATLGKYFHPIQSVSRTNWYF